MAKRTPDRKVSQGSIVGVAAAALTLWLTHLTHATGLTETLITSGVGLAANFVGGYLAPYQARIEEIVAYVKKLVNEVPPAVE